MNDSEKIQAIKRIFRRFHSEDSNLDTIDVCIRIESILED